MNEFLIDFVFEQKPFTGLVIPGQKDDNIIYSIKVESQDQELNLSVIAIPCGEGKSEWCSLGAPDEGSIYDPALLQEIGEAIEKYQMNNQDTSG